MIIYLFQLLRCQAWRLLPENSKFLLADSLSMTAFPPFTTTNVTKLIATATCHMITTFIFLNIHLTTRTLLRSRGIDLFQCHLVLFLWIFMVFKLFTSHFVVEWCFTFEAKSLSTCHTLVLGFPCSFKKVVTVRIWTLCS